MAANEDDFHTLGSGTGFDQTGLRIIHLSQTSLQIQNGFEHLKSEFFKSCEDENATETFWIIKVTKTGSCNKGVEFFAAAKDDNSRNVEKVFTDWWDLYIKHRQKDKDHQYQFEIYSSRRLSRERKGFLNDWLENRPLVNLSIHLAPSSSSYLPTDNWVAIRRMADTESELEKLEEEIRLKMDWLIVKLNDDNDPKLVPAKFLGTETRCRLPADGTSLDHFKAAVRNEAPPKNSEFYTVKRILEGAADYQSGFTILESIRDANGSDGSSESDSAPEVDSNLVQLSQTSLQFQNGFEYLVSKFFKSCGNSATGVTSWIIKLTKTCDKGSKYTFAAAKNDSGRHVEKVFTDWWELCKKDTSLENYKYEFEVYTNHTPCVKGYYDRARMYHQSCDKELRDLLKYNSSTVKLSIHYAFVYDKSKKSEEEMEKEYKILHERKELVTIKRLDKGTLDNLIRDVGFGGKFETGQFSSESTGEEKKYEDAVNYPRPKKTTRKTTS